MLSHYRVAEVLILGQIIRCLKVTTTTTKTNSRQILLIFYKTSLPSLEVLLSSI